MKKILLHNIYEQMNRNNEIFRLDSPNNRDDCLSPLYHLKSELGNHGFQLDTIDQGDVMECDYLLFFDIPSFFLDLESNYFLRYLTKENFKRKMLLFLWEPPTTHANNWIAENYRHFGTIFTWYDDIVDHQKYVKIQHPQPDRRYLGKPFQEKKLCTMICSRKSSEHPLELYSERERAIRYFEQYHPEEFDLYGFGWDSGQFPSYRGVVEEKGKVLSQYKFAICYENMGGANGYITEKIFDCFRSGCVPVYLGAVNIGKYIPPDTFIDLRQFQSYEELYQRLQQVSDEQYAAYLRNIDKFLSGDMYAEHFSIQAFCRTVINRILELNANSCT
ncbi:glycosyltransferase family 10 domain-containing protein [Effusibacillus consociatus]|uniref:Glycosyltransferase family 10 domain-containing protein n=1 Tax=Effusibacillus consociatus TaxID=1117041 RepID=A0ABV9PZ87_9BACL